MAVDSLCIPRPVHDPQHRSSSVEALSETFANSRMTRGGFERFKGLVPFALEAIQIVTLCLKQLLSQGPKHTGGHGPNATAIPGVGFEMPLLAARAANGHQPGPRSSRFVEGGVAGCRFAFN